MKLISRLCLVGLAVLCATLLLNCNNAPETQETAKAPSKLDNLQRAIKQSGVTAHDEKNNLWAIVAGDKCTGCNSSNTAYRIDLWSGDTGKELLPVAVNEFTSIHKLLFSPDGKHLAVFPSEADRFLGDVEIYEIEDLHYSSYQGFCSRQDQVLIVKDCPADYFLDSAVFTPDSRYLVMGGRMSFEHGKHPYRTWLTRIGMKDSDTSELHLDKAFPYKATGSDWGWQGAVLKLSKDQKQLVVEQNHYTADNFDRYYFDKEKKTVTFDLKTWKRLS